MNNQEAPRGTHVGWPVPVGFVMLAASGAVGASMGSPWLVGAVAGMALTLAVLSGTDVSAWSIKAGREGVDLSAQREVAQKQREVEQALGRALEDADATHDSEPAESPDSETAPDAELARRQSIEALMTVAAQWGWYLAKSGFGKPPEPVLTWDDGEPTILYGRGTDMPYFTPRVEVVGEPPTAPGQHWVANPRERLEVPRGGVHRVPTPPSDPKRSGDHPGPERA